MYWDAPAQTVWLKRVFNSLFPRRILCQLIMRYEKRGSKSRCPPTIDWFFLWFEMPTLYLNCQRQQDPLTSSSQVIAMQMRSSRDKLAGARQWPCPLVCLPANRVMYLKKFPVDECGTGKISARSAWKTFAFHRWKSGVRRIWHNIFHL